MNISFEIKDERKIRRHHINIHKSLRITVEIHETNKKLTVTFQPKNACKLESADHLWQPFFDQPHSDTVVFAIITFHTYHILVLE